MTTPTDDNRDLVTVFASMQAKAGREDELRAALTSLIAPVTAEEGNVNYDLHESVDTPGLFFFYENWESADALAKHSQEPHMKEMLGKAGELLDGPLSVNVVRRIA
ncbi:putative quinol monooxygenase [Pseudonocardia spinosispora]|uniref:putative quinol monooxygenase n=1 Tax=Pseudonocardia spinosispora TaxID=103441 RepID=UPI00041271FB|nr:putative quinol monooxygenase [Pseudonocardia spinosispora]